MEKKKRGENITSVKFSYVGTDAQFNEFLKMMIHDHLAVDGPYTNRQPDLVDKVGSEVA